MAETSPLENAEHIITNDPDYSYYRKLLATIYICSRATFVICVKALNIYIACTQWRSDRGADGTVAPRALVQGAAH